MTAPDVSRNEDTPRDESIPDDPGIPGGHPDRRPARHGPDNPERLGEPGGMDQAAPAFGLPDGRRLPGLYRVFPGGHRVAARTRAPLTRAGGRLQSTLTIGTTFPSCVNSAT